MTGAGPRAAAPHDPLTLDRAMDPGAPARSGSRLFAFRRRTALRNFAASSRRPCPQRQRRAPRVWKQAGAALALAATLVLAGCGKSKAAKPAQGAGAAGGAMQGMPVHIEAATPEPVPVSSTYVASIQSLSSMTISPLVGGIIRDIYVRSGDHVRSGQPLLQIDPSLQQATVQNLENSRAALASTLIFDKQQLARAKQLYQEKIGTLQDYQSALSTYNTAEAQLHSLDAQIQQAKVTLGYYRVTAPRAGIIGDIPVRVGDQVTTQTQLTTIDSPSGLQVYVQVPVSDSGRLRMGLPVTVVDGQGNLVAKTQIGFISPQVDDQTQTILVKANLPNTQRPVRTNEYVQATVTWGTTQAYLIPVLSVQQEGTQSFVFLAAPRGKGFFAHQVPVETGVVQGNDYQITSGLKPGDKVIVSTTQLLHEGMPVIPMPANAGGSANGGAGSHPASSPAAQSGAQR